jgi:hypothetical protein
MAARSSASWCTSEIRALVVALIVAAGCHRTPGASAPPDAGDRSSPGPADGAADARDAAPDAAPADAEPADAAPADAAAPDADAARTRRGPCARCRKDEYCLVVHRSGGVERPAGRSTTTTASCEKLPMPGCAHPSCACLEASGPCSVREGRLRVEAYVRAP